MTTSYYETCYRVTKEAHVIDKGKYASEEVTLEMTTKERVLILLFPDKPMVPRTGNY